MNQILYYKDNSNSTKPFFLQKISSYKHFFMFQFMFSSLLVFVIISMYFFNYYHKNKQENVSKKLVNNYNISTLYSNNSTQTYKTNGSTFSVIGLIEIPKISIHYPILSNSSEELLKIAPCRISGPLPNENGNLCIAGHNYDNYKFFSKLSTLSNNDEIIIYDINGNKNSYFVYNMYEVSYDNLSPLKNENNIKKQITLITCNNINSNKRLIVKAKPN